MLEQTWIYRYPWQIEITYEHGEDVLWIVCTALFNNCLIQGAVHILTAFQQVSIIPYAMLYK